MQIAREASAAPRAALDVRALEDMGEWAALGFYEGLDLPWPRAYGMAYRRLYEHMPVRVPGDRWLVPCEPFYEARTMESHGVWHAEALICDFDHNRGLRINAGVAEEKRARYPHYAALIDELLADLRPRLPHFGGYTHSNPDMRRVVEDGFVAMVAELEAELANVRASVSRGDPHAPKELNLLLALQDYALGVTAYHARAVVALQEAAAEASGERSRQLALLAQALGRAFMQPAQTFLEGLLAMHMAWMLDGCDSFGRPDQVLGTLYERDLATGALEPDFAQALLDEVWRNFERFNGWNLQLGGASADGSDGYNALTSACIEACRRNRQRRPNVTLRIGRDTPDEALLHALRVLREGSGRPALYNDDLYQRALLDLDLGLTAEDAREVGFGGCTETMIAGLSNVGSLEGYLNMAKALELALHDGYDPIQCRQGGPNTGAFSDMASFDDLLAATRAQIRHMTEAFVAEHDAALARRFREGDPKPYRTLFTRDCVRRHRSFEAGGARYNWANVSYEGFANLADSLAAIKEFVYEKRAVSPGQLLSALEADWEGHEPLRRLMMTAPRFGNDDHRVDAIAQDLMAYAWEQLLAHPTPRGGRYVPSCILFVTYERAGREVGATPDGRRAFEVLTDSVGPAQGRDTRGPTAMLRSVTGLPLRLGAGTPVLNLRLSRALLDREDDLRQVAALIRTYFAQGGLQIQISVLSREEMLAAQREPEKHGDLIVRVGGYSEYFVRLSAALQESIIARTEHVI